MEAATLTVADIKDVDRVELQHKVHAEAVNEIHRLNGTMKTAFDKLLKSRQTLEGMGVATECTFPFPIQQAFTAYKTSGHRTDPLTDAPIGK